MALPILVGMAIYGVATSAATYGGLHGAEYAARRIKNRRKKVSPAQKPKGRIKKVAAKRRSKPARVEPIAAPAPSSAAGSE